MSWKQLKNNSYYSINEDGVVKRNAYTRVDKLGRNFNKSSSNIISCANGNLNTAYGYVWRWA